MITGASRTPEAPADFRSAVQRRAPSNHTVWPDAWVKQIDPDYIIPAHCTGLNTIIAVHRAIPQKLVMPSTGTRVIFGA
jgi:7,8-dihydropterin-6-yl-methyl-4-(beta-D-ribofuranosyl)aminobenzene 5'-phosphate synthase